MLEMSDTPNKSLKKSTAEFVRSHQKLDKNTLVSFVKEVIQQQHQITVTAHHDEEGEIDCICLGDLCNVSYVPSEQKIGCKRLQWLFVGENTKDERERQEDFVEV